MIELEENRIKVSGKKLPKGDVDILKILIKNGPMTAHKISEMRGQIFDQYTQGRLRFLKSAVLDCIVVKSGSEYEINPEIKEELEEALKMIK